MLLQLNLELYVPLDSACHTCRMRAQEEMFWGMPTAAANGGAAHQPATPQRAAPAGPRAAAAAPVQQPPQPQASSAQPAPVAGQSSEDMDAVRLPPNFEVKPVCGLCAVITTPLPFAQSCVTACIFVDTALD